MNHLKTVSDEAMSLLRSAIKLNVADVKKIHYSEKREKGNGKNVKMAILVECTKYKQRHPYALYT
jgi:hypothetical protein